MEGERIISELRTAFIGHDLEGLALEAAFEIERLRAALLSHASVLDPDSYDGEAFYDLRVIVEKMRRDACGQ